MYSFPLSSIVGFAAGIYAGEKVRKAIEPYNVSPLVGNVAIKGAHMLASAAIGGIINGLSADIPGAVAQTELSIFTGLHHDSLVHFMMAADGSIHAVHVSDLAYAMRTVRV